MGKMSFVFSGAVLLSFLLSGCVASTSSSSGSSTSSTANAAPIIVGVTPEVTIHLGETFDALAGVSATDLEDGNLTNRIIISSTPTLVNNDGILFPDAQGEYYLTYSVTDNGLLTSEEYATLIVNAPLPTETLFRDFSFDDNAALDLEDWTFLLSEEAEATTTPFMGAMRLEIGNPGLSSSDISFLKPLQTISEGVTYRIEVVLKTVTVGNVMLNVYDDENPDNLLSSETIVLTTEYTIASTSFIALSSQDTVTYEFSFGGALNDAETEILIQKATIVEERGIEVDTQLLLDDFSETLEPWAFQAYAGSAATLTSTTQQMEFIIEAYAGENKPWNINLYRPTTIDIVSGNVYEIRFTVTSTIEQFYELCFEDQTMDWKIRAGFKNGTFSAGLTEFAYRFTASGNITGLYIKLALGQGSGTQNTLLIDNFEFVTIGGNLEVTSTETIFVTADEEIAWSTYNTEGGEGMTYIEGEELVYQINAFGEVDWHNKLVIDDISLTVIARYRFEFSLRASTQVETSFIVNEMGAWNPLINQTLTIPTETTLFSYTMEDLLYTDLTVELLWQFGGFAANIAPASIHMSSLTIYRIA